MSNPGTRNGHLISRFIPWKEAMPAVALVGGDGSGKTTIARCLERSEGLRVKYLYMGVSTRSSNHALPTSRLILFFKQLAYRKGGNKIDKAQSDQIPASYLEYGESKRGPVWLVLRLLNRLAEASYRQFISYYYQLRGYLVVYDRYLLFDTTPEPDGTVSRFHRKLDERLYKILDRWFPKPDLIIFLDAPAEVLYARKQDASLDYLNRMRSTYLEQGKKLSHFVRIDATQSLEKVLEDVTQHITDLRTGKSTRMLISNRR